MEIQGVQKKLKKGLERVREKFRVFFEVAKAVWKAGIPSRFWLVFFVVGVVAGAGLKFWAENHFTIGYEDYRLLPKERVYDINAAQERVISQGGELTEPQNPSSYPSESVDTNTGL